MQRRLPQRRLKLRLTRRSEVESGKEPQATFDGSAASSAVTASTRFWRKRSGILATVLVAVLSLW